MTYNFSRIYERPHTDYMTGKTVKIYSVHESSFCFDVPSTMTLGKLENHIKSRIDHQKHQLGRITDCYHSK